MIFLTLNDKLLSLSRFIICAFPRIMEWNFVVLQWEKDSIIYKKSNSEKGRTIPL